MRIVANRWVTVLWLSGTLVTTAQAQIGVQSPRAVLDEAARLDENLQPDEAIEVLRPLIDTLRATFDAGELSTEQRQIFVDSLALRVKADVEDASRGPDLALVFRLETGFNCELFVTLTLIARCQEVRAELVGRLALQISPVGGQQLSPVDAIVQVDGRVIDWDGGPIEILAGLRLISVGGLGWQQQSASVEVTPGPDAPTPHVVDLLRVSSVLRIITRPSGVTVVVDGLDRGTTQGAADGDSSALTVAGLGADEARVTLTLEGYRTVSGPVTFNGFGDYSLNRVLERAEGTVVFDGVPEGATVEIARSGAPASTQVAEDSGPVTLPVGDYDVVVAHPVAGYFAEVVTVVDLGEHRVSVRLLPTVAMLGVLGGDDIGRDVLMRSLDDVFDRLDGWMLQDRTAEGEAIVAEAEASIDRLRRQVNPFAARVDQIDWSALQAAADDMAPSSVYLLGVLDDDLAAQFADLWIWRSAPGPAMASRVRVSLAGDGLDTPETVVGRAFDDVSVERPWLGALLIETDAEPGPFVATVTDGGPAQAAGILPGDIIVSVNDLPVSSVVEVTARLLSSPSPLTVTVRRAGMPVVAELAAGSGPLVVPRRDPTIAYSVISARLAATMDRPSSGQPSWVWELNQAAASMEVGDWDRALATLRRIEPETPAGAGVAAGAVRYRLGLAYMMAGPRYRDLARQSFQQAADDVDARLFHNDGPWVAPRARARLAELNRSTP